jgi:hypothetical protein
MSNFVMKDGCPSQINSSKINTEDRLQESSESQGLYLQAMVSNFVICWKAVDTLTESTSYGMERGDDKAVMYVACSSGVQWTDAISIL